MHDRLSRLGTEFPGSDDALTALSADYASEPVDAALIAARLRMYRRTRKLRLREMAKAVDTTPQTVSRLENGETTLTVDWLFKICAALGIDPAELVKREDHRDVPVVGTIGDTQSVEFIPPSKHEIVSLNGHDPNLLAVRMKITIGPYHHGDLLIARPTGSLWRGNRDWGACLVSMGDETPSLKYVLQARDGQWIVLPLTHAHPAQFTERISYLARVVTVVRHLPDDFEDPPLDHDADVSDDK